MHHYPKEVTAITSSLREASKGLLYPSEADEPFNTVILAQSDYEDFKKKGDEFAKTDGEPQTFAEFFDSMEPPEEEKQRWALLNACFTSNLSNLRTLRIGRGGNNTEVDVYIIGENFEKSYWIGLKTLAIET